MIYKRLLMIPFNLTLCRKLVLALGLALASTLSIGQERWQSDQYITDSFLKIALQREYRETANPKLIRWEQPIKLYFQSEAGDASFQKELLSVHAQHLSYITGLPIDFTDDVKQANIYTIFTQYDRIEDRVRQYIGDPNRIRAALDEAICLGNFSVNKRGEILRGVIIIPVDYARQKARFLDCIIEEITQLMGLPNDSNDVFPSVFNDVSVDTYLSPLDYLLLKTLYSPRLQTNMDVPQVLARMPAVLSDLHAQGEIENATQNSLRYSLKRYLGE